MTVEALPFLVRFEKTSRFYYVKINEKRQVWVNRVTFSVLGLVLFSSGSQEHQRDPPGRRRVSFQHSAWSWPDRLCSDNQPPGGIPPERQTSFESLQKLTSRNRNKQIRFDSWTICQVCWCVWKPVSFVTGKMSHLFCTTNSRNVQTTADIPVQKCWIKVLMIFCFI